MMDGIQEVMDQLTDQELEILADFERRIGILYDHKQLIRKLILIIESLKKQQSRKIKDNLIEIAQPLQKKLQISFYSFKLPEILSALSDKEKQVLNYEIEQLSKRLASFSEKRLSEQQKKKFDALLQEEQEELSLLEFFEGRIKRFQKIIDAQKQSISSELQTLDEIISMSKKNFIPETILDGWLLSLKKFQDDVERLLKAEREIIHVPIELIIEKLKRGARLAEQLLKQKKITPSRIKQDIQTFSTPEEYRQYHRKLRRSGELSAASERLLEKGEIFSIVASEKKTSFMRRLKKMALIDQLTKLYNRHHLKSEVKKFIHQVNRGDLKHFAIMIFDIDHFKLFNDTYGHDIGDQVLQFVAKIAKKAVRDYDIVARWGGEEFVIVFVGLEKSEAIKHANRIRTDITTESEKPLAKINKETNVENPCKAITVSMGLAVYPEDNPQAKDIDDLLKTADQLLYKAKKSGRNRLVSL